MKNSKTKNSITHSILLMGAVISSLTVVSMSSVYAQDQVNSEYKPGNLIYDKWDRFYKIEQAQPQEAEKILVELSKLTPTDIKVWKSLTYLQIRLEKRDEALQSLRQARALAPQDDTLKLQEAYLLNQQKKDRDALVLFKELTSSSDPAIAAKATKAVTNLS
ncbi:tetratricopeptide repeat protein, partial [Acinetobacter nosocomialis]|uniref:tetratricopeptide repeat protein n=1 Tax=Acinetobacter nosocomialis TaxID=106654 RepID=UPI0035A23F75